MDLHGPCPDSALLAAYLDGALADDERRAVVLHLAECAQCRAVAVTVVEFREVQALDRMWTGDVSTTEQHVPRVGEVTRWAHRKTRAPAVLIPAVTAVLVAAVVWSIRPTPPPPTAEDVLTTATSGARLTLARFSDFPAGPRGAVRDANGEADGRVIAAAARVRDNYLDDYGPRGRRAVGLAATLLGDLDEAIENLSIASLAAPHDARVVNDLAAAYLERAERQDRPEDLPAGLDAAERAVRLQPNLVEAWFNRALALSALGLRADADAAWREYRGRDRSSVWSEEARSRQEQVWQGVPSAAWESVRASLRAQPNAEVARVAVRDHAAATRELFHSALQEWSVAAASGPDRRDLRELLRLLGEAFASVQNERYYLAIATNVADALEAGHARRLAIAQQQLFGAERGLTPAGSEQAEAALQRAAHTLQALRSPLALRAELDLALASYYRGRHHDASLRAVAVRGTAERLRYRVPLSRTYWISGLAAFARGDVADARLQYEQMLDVARLPGDVDQYVMALVLLANVHDVLGDNHMAWKYRRAALPLIDLCGTPSTRTNVLLSAAGHATASEHRAAALLFESRALRLSEGISPASEVLARIQRAATLHHVGDTAAAQSELRRAGEQMPAIGDALLRARRQSEMLALQSEWLQQSDPAASLQVAERAIDDAGSLSDRYWLSRLHVRLADAALAANQLPRADDAITRAIELVAPLRRAHGRDEMPSDHDSTLYARAAQIAHRRGDLARAFEYAELRRVRAFPGARLPHGRVMSLAEVQRQLRHETALAVLNQIEEQLYVWLVLRDHVVTHVIDLPASRAAALVLSQMQELKMQSAVPQISGQLFDAIFRPLERHLTRISTLVIISDAPYSRLAYPAMWDRERRRYLVEDFRLVSATSATTFVATAGPEPRIPRNPARVAVVDTLPDATPAAGSQRRLGAVSDIYGARGVRTLRAATPSKVIEALARQDVVHLATRYVGSGETPAKARLTAVDEPGKKYSGSLSAARLAGLRRVRAQLVGIDAEPLSGAPQEAEATRHITDALLTAGVLTVVASTAAVPAKTLEPTWIDFHRHYASGVAPAESLRRAQIAALSASARRPGPWATLTVFGSN